MDHEEWPDRRIFDQAHLQVTRATAQLFQHRVDFGRFADADGLIYLGARSLSKGEANYSAIAGPLDPASGLLFSYFDKNGALLTPGVHPPVNVRTVQVQLTGRTASQVAMAGTRLANRGMITTTRVALRNTLKH